MYRQLDRLSALLAICSTALGCVFAVVMVVTLLLGVFYRYALQSSLAWSDEVALLAFTWTVFLFTSVLVRGYGHVRVTFLLGLLPGPLVEVIERLNVLIVLVFAVIMVWVGYGFAEFTASQVSPAIRYPLWLRNAALPVSGALIVVHALVILLRPGSLKHLVDPTTASEPDHGA